MLRSYPAGPVSHEGQGGKKRVARYELEGWQPAFLVSHSGLFVVQANLVFLYACSPGEEMALVEHLKGMALTGGAKNELKSLLVVLIQLGKEESARQVQQAADSFEVSQRAAVKLAEDTVCNDKVDENAHTLEHYIRLLRARWSGHDETGSWRIKALSPP